MTTQCQHIQELLAEGTINEDVKAHVSHCMECSALVHGLSRLDLELPGASRISAPLHVTKAVFDALPTAPVKAPAALEGSIEARTRRSHRAIPYLALACVILIAVGSYQRIFRGDFSEGFEIYAATDILQGIGCIGGLAALFLPSANRFTVSALFFAVAFIGMILRGV